MTQNDKNLIEKVENMHYSGWTSISNLIKQADTQECKTRLDNISKHYHHMEEAYNNDL